MTELYIFLQFLVISIAYIIGRRLGHWKGLNSGYEMGFEDGENAHDI